MQTESLLEHLTKEQLGVKVMRKESIENNDPGSDAPIEEAITQTRKPDGYSRVNGTQQWLLSGLS